MARKYLEQLRSSVERPPSLVWRAGSEGQCHYFNFAWLEFTGHTLEEELARTWAARLHPGDLERFLPQWQSHLTRRQPFETQLRLLRWDGTYRHFHMQMTTYPDERGDFAGFNGDCFELDEVSESDAFSGGSEFFQMSLDLLCVAGFDGHLRRVNPAWTKALGWTEEELLSRPSIEFVHPEDRASTLRAREGLKAQDPLLGFNNRYICKDGSLRWLEWQSVGHLERRVIYASARDVTTQREAERALHEAKELQELMQRQLILTDRLASVGMLAAGVAHEINNPLAYVTANLDLLSEELKRAQLSSTPVLLDQWLEAVREARAGSNRIGTIVRGLNTLSRPEEERRAVLELVPVLELSVNMAFNELRQRARLVKEYGQTPLVEADDARLSQVFINLIINAAQAIPEGDSEAHEVRIVTSTDGLGRAVIDVLDTGPGIPADVLPRVFDPFFTTKPIGVGTGLGLSICHSIIAGLGGEISASNRQGRGARLRVVLAPARAVAAVSPKQVPSPKAPAGSAAVLIVDDERSVAAILSRVLRHHRVTTVTSAREALDLIRAEQRFDLILSDLMMPGMSGMDLYETLAQERPELIPRMAFMSGGAFTPAARAFLDRIPNERIEKPFPLEKIRELVERFCQ